MAAPVLQVERLRVVRRRRVVLDEVSFGLGLGVTALLGPNGIGKTTLLRALASVDRASSGRIRLGDPSRSPDQRAYRRAVGYLPQDLEIIGRFTVTDALRYAAWLHEVSDIEAATAAVLRDLELTDHASAKLKTLSGGTRRRVMLGQAIIHRPPLLLLDEPTVGMDAHHRFALRRCLEVLAETCAVLLSTHVFADVDALGDHVLVLGPERLAFDGTAAELIGRGDELAGPGASHAEPAIDRAVRLVSGR